MFTVAPPHHDGLSSGRFEFTSPATYYSYPESNNDGDRRRDPYGLPPYLFRRSDCVSLKGDLLSVFKKTTSDYTRTQLALANRVLRVPFIYFAVGQGLVDTRDFVSRMNRLSEQSLF